MEFHYIRHVPYEGPGFIGDWCAEHGISLSQTRPYEGEPFPDPARLDWLIVLGGPMGVHDEQEHPWLVEEKRFLEAALDRDLPILGVCLGAQLLAHVLGAEVRRHEHPEIGWHAVKLTEHGVGSPLEEFVRRDTPVMQWHYDTFEIPDGARHLARNDACERQAFTWGDRVLALQFHPEMTYEEVATVVERDGPLPEGPHVQTADEILDRRPFRRAAIATRHFMDRLVAQTPGSKPVGETSA